MLPGQCAINNNKNDLEQEIYTWLIVRSRYSVRIFHLGAMLIENFGVRPQPMSVTVSGEWRLLNFIFIFHHYYY